MPTSLLPRLPPLPAVRDLLNLFRLRAVKQLSQNFLLEPKLTSKLVAAAGRIKDGYVYEVGPGAGSLTRVILSKGVKNVVVIEKDRRFQPVLEMLVEASDGDMSIVWGDVLSHNLAKSFPIEAANKWEDKHPNVHIIGNLPFNVATPLIIRWLKAISEQTNAWTYGRVPLTLTFQKEVAERIVAPIGSHQRCRLSVMCQHLCHVQHKFTIPGRAFVPKPDVDVGVVRFVPLVTPLIQCPFPLVEKVVRTTFTSRQKYCRKNLEKLFPTPLRPVMIETLLDEANVDGNLRPFQLSVDEFNRICIVYQKICERNPALLKYDPRSEGGIDDEMIMANML